MRLGPKELGMTFNSQRQKLHATVIFLVRCLEEASKENVNVENKPGDLY